MKIKRLKKNWEIREIKKDVKTKNRENERKKKEEKVMEENKRLKSD